MHKADIAKTSRFGFGDFAEQIDDLPRWAGLEPLFTRFTRTVKFA